MDLNSALKQAYPAGWVQIYLSILQATAARMDEATAQEIFYQAGLQIAGRFPLQADGSFDLLEAELNSLLGHLSWGGVEIAQRSTGVEVRHYGFPGLGVVDPAHYPLVGVLLGGMYFGWFSSLGMDEEAEVSVVTDEIGYTAEISFKVN